MASIIIEKGGLLTTIQDGGRHGYRRFGMPVSGAMDMCAYNLANHLAGNSPGAALLEATLIAPEIMFKDDIDPERLRHIAVCGADMQPCINGESVPMNRAVEIRNGDRLTFAGLKWGCRTYIAFEGGLDVPLIMGSRSTYLRAAIGGYDGRPLKSGDLIPLGHDFRTNDNDNERCTDRDKNRNNDCINVYVDDRISDRLYCEQIPDYQSSQPIRIYPGPELKRIGFEGLRTLLTREFTVTPQSDRMGLRLSGEPIYIKNIPNTTNQSDSNIPSHDIVSAGIPIGTIQLPSNGQMIILTADCQPTGGYARIAFVSEAHLCRIAQLKPGDKLRFRE
ncbi:MAG: biotin-dependent carboxyltransferase family protein [Bacteroidales bacterium]